MAVVPDYHLHTALCHHATGEPTDYAAHAIQIGLKEIGFSDHAPMPRDDFDDWRMRFDQLDLYVEKVHHAQQDHPELSIKLGLELDYIPGQEEWLRKLASRHPWDYLIGSVHYISDSWAVDNPNQISLWKESDPYDIWSTYFKRLTLAAGSGLFDIVGHADLPKKFGFYPRQDCRPLLEEFLRTAVRMGLVVELNTAGFRKECRELYPSLDILQRMCRLGIAITFGSDAHAPGEVGSHLAEAVEEARKAGYTQYCRFTRRERSMVAME